MSTPNYYYHYPETDIPWINVLLDKEPSRLGIEITAGAMTVILITYLIVVRSLRYRYINQLKQKYPDPTVALHDLSVAEEVFYISGRREFPCRNI